MQAFHNKTAGSPRPLRQQQCCFAFVIFIFLTTLSWDRNYRWAGFEESSAALNLLYVTSLWCFSAALQDGASEQVPVGYFLLHLTRCAQPMGVLQRVKLSFIMSRGNYFLLFLNLVQNKNVREWKVQFLFSDHQRCAETELSNISNYLFNIF